jgi:hypothetical protein
MSERLLPNESAALQAVAVIDALVEGAGTKGDSEWWEGLKRVVSAYYRRPEPPRREAEMAELRSRYEHYEAALASARKLRDKRLYELTEIAYLASMRPYLGAVFALTPAKGKEK